MRVKWSLILLFALYCKAGAYILDGSKIDEPKEEPSPGEEPSPEEEPAPEEDPVPGGRKMHLSDEAEGRALSSDTADDDEEPEAPEGRGHMSSGNHLHGRRPMMGGGGMYGDRPMMNGGRPMMDGGGMYGGPMMKPMMGRRHGPPRRRRPMVAPGTPGTGHMMNHPMMDPHGAAPWQPAGPAPVPEPIPEPIPIIPESDGPAVAPLVGQKEEEAEGKFLGGFGGYGGYAPLSYTEALVDNLYRFHHQWFIQGYGGVWDGPRYWQGLDWDRGVLY